MATGIRGKPIKVTTVPVTTGGKNFLITGIKKLPIVIAKEATNVEPKMPATPYSEPTAIDTPIKVKLVPITQSNLTPLINVVQLIKWMHQQVAFLQLCIKYL